MSELVQGSADWLNWRNKGIGSSEISTIIGENPYETAENLFLLKTNQKPAKDLSNNFAVKRGTALEPIARNLFNETTNSKYEPVTMIMPNFTFARYSSDGLDMEKRSIIEIKCMMQKNHEKFASTGEYPSYYKAQMHWAMMIANVDHCFFVAFNPEFPDPLQYLKIEADHVYQTYLLHEAAKFWKKVNDYLSLVK